MTKRELNFIKKNLKFLRNIEYDINNVYTYMPADKTTKKVLAYLSKSYNFNPKDKDIHFSYVKKVLIAYYYAKAKYNDSNKKTKPILVSKRILSQQDLIFIKDNLNTLRDFEYNIEDTDTYIPANDITKQVLDYLNKSYNFNLKNRKFHFSYVKKALIAFFYAENKYHIKTGGSLLLAIIKGKRINIKKYK